MSSSAPWKESHPLDCVFCGDRADSGEHVWPEWLKGVMPDRGKVRYHRSIDRPTGESETADWRGHDYDLIVNCVCARCNNGWMSRLESAAKPWLQSMARANGRDLYEQGQTTVAAWAVLKAMMFNCKDREDPIPAAHHTELYACRDNPRPPSDTQVWIGAHTQTGADYKRHFALTLNPATGPPSDAYGVTFTVGHLVLQVFGHEVGAAAERQLSGPLGRALPQIWPIISPKVIWPPELVLSLSDLVAASNTFTTP